MTPQQATLMSIGTQMSNVLWNLGQHKRREITEREGELFYALAKKWDEARRAPAPTEPAVDRNALILVRAAAKDMYNKTYAEKRLRLTSGDAAVRDAAEAAGKVFVEALKATEHLATPASPAVPAPAPLAPKPAMSMFATLDDYRAALASFDERMADPLTRIIVEQTGNFPAAPQLPQASQPTSAEGKDGEQGVERAPIIGDGSGSYCLSCRGEGITHTGCDDAPTTYCNACDGTGYQSASTGKNTDKEQPC